MRLIYNLKQLDNLLKRLFANLAEIAVGGLALIFMMGGGLVLVYVVMLFMGEDFKIFEFIKISLLSIGSWYLGFGFYQMLQKFGMNDDDVDDLIKLP